MAGLARIAKLYGAITINGQKYVWDYVKDECVPEHEMPAGSPRWQESERKRWPQAMLFGIVPPHPTPPVKAYREPHQQVKKSARKLIMRCIYEALLAEGPVQSYKLHIGMDDNPNFPEMTVKAFRCRLAELRRLGVVTSYKLDGDFYWEALEGKGDLIEGLK